MGGKKTKGKAKNKNVQKKIVPKPEEPERPKAPVEPERPKAPVESERPKAPVEPKPQDRFLTVSGRTQIPLAIRDRAAITEKPLLIPIKTFKKLEDVLLTFPAQHRNVIFTVSDYKLKDVFPSMKKPQEPLTHIIIFSIRIATKDLFQPIGAVQINLKLNQYKQLAFYWKTYIEDLSILRLKVIGSVSPHGAIYKSTLGFFTQMVGHMDFYGPISYTVESFNDFICHFFNSHMLLRELYDLFEKYGLVEFISSPLEGTSPGRSLELYIANFKYVKQAATKALRSSKNKSVTFAYEDICNTSFMKYWEKYINSSKSTIERVSTDYFVCMLFNYYELAHGGDYLMIEDLGTFFCNVHNLHMMICSCRFDNALDVRNNEHLAQKETDEDQKQKKDKIYSEVICSSPVGIYRKSNNFKPEYKPLFENKDEFDYLFGEMKFKVTDVPVRYAFLNTIQSYYKIKFIMEIYRIRYLDSQALSADHNDYFVNYIRTNVNKQPKLFSNTKPHDLFSIDLALDLFMNNRHHHTMDLNEEQMKAFKSMFPKET